MTPDQWRTFRLVRGTYGQRQADDAQMLRVKVPQGVLSADQLVALADVGDACSRGFGHITTRQNVQFHFVKLHDVEPAMRRLAEAGLTTREACGNSVRNITACAYAGVAADERFDVTPYAEAMTRHLLRHPLSSTLPRKFKIAFEGCAEDHIATAINDLSFRARVTRDGARGFRVDAGGGTAIMPTQAGLLHEFLPASEILRAADAVLRVFARFGDYQHKQRNRMKFMIKTLGWTRWREEYDRELAACRLRGSVPTLDIDPPAAEPRPDLQPESSPSVGYVAARVASGRVRGPGLVPTVVPLFRVGDEAYAAWRSSNVRSQKQFGFVMAVVTVPLGDLTSEQMRIVAELARAYGDGTRAADDRSERAVPLGERVRRAPAVSPPRRRRPRPGGRRDDRRRGELPRRGIVPPRGDAVARPGAAARGSSARAARPDGGGGRRAHQDQRLPERLRPASHRDVRLPGQRAADRVAAGAAVLRDGRRRRDRTAAPASRGSRRRFRRAAFPMSWSG